MVTLSFLRDGLRCKICMGGSKVGYIISDKGEFKGSFQGFKLGPSLLLLFLIQQKEAAQREKKKPHYSLPLQSPKDRSVSGGGGVPMGLKCITNVCKCKTEEMQENVSRSKLHHHFYTLPARRGVCCVVSGPR